MRTKYNPFVKELPEKTAKNRLKEQEKGEDRVPSRSQRAAHSRGIDPNFGGTYRNDLLILARTRHTCTRNILKKLLVLAVITAILFPLTIGAQNEIRVPAAFPGRRTLGPRFDDSSVVWSFRCYQHRMLSEFRSVFVYP
jgi:hypothetical protein